MAAAPTQLRFEHPPDVPECIRVGQAHAHVRLEPMQVGHESSQEDLCPLQSVLLGHKTFLSPYKRAMSRHKEHLLPLKSVLLGRKDLMYKDKNVDFNNYLRIKHEFFKLNVLKRTKDKLVFAHLLLLVAALAFKNKGKSKVAQLAKSSKKTNRGFTKIRQRQALSDEKLKQ